MTLTIEQLDTASPEQFSALLAGIYEHSPWIAQRAAALRPLGTLAALKLALARVVREAGRDEQLGLVRAHPELAGKAMVARTLTAESTREQGSAGLSQCTPQEHHLTPDVLDVAPQREDVRAACSTHLTRVCARVRFGVK